MEIIDKEQMKSYTLRLVCKDKDKQRLYAFNSKHNPFINLIETDILQYLPLEKWVKGMFYGKQSYLYEGYLCVEDIKEIIYEPCYINHALKDDCIAISYGNPIAWQEDNYGYKYYKCDIKIYGREIIDVLKGAEKYSNYDISKIKEQIWQKMLWLKENEPDCFDREVISKEDFNKWWID